MQAILRNIKMLSFIPRHPKKMSTSQIKEKLDAADYPVDIRTIQRNLDELSRKFPLIRDDRKPAGWSWSEDAELLNIPRMDTHTALTFALVESYISQLLPLSTLDYLKPHFEHAHKILALSKNQYFNNWTEKVRILPRGQRLQSPMINPAIMDIVYRALFNNVCFDVVYQPRKGTEKEYTVHPHGLVYRNGVAYLVCSLYEYNNIVQLVLHRMKSAVLCESPSLKPDNFDLDAYISQGNFGFLQSDKMIKLVAHFTNEAAYHLHEVWLSSDQKLIPKEDYTVVNATVNDTHQLRWWLLGFGDAVVVKKPQSLVSDMRAMIATMYNNYKSR